MTRDEIVTALRCCDGGEYDECYKCPMRDGINCRNLLDLAAADLIENQQRHIDALMKANDSLKDAIARRDKQIEDTGLTPGDIKELLDMAVSKTDKVLRLKEELHTIKNELCQYCGKYKQAHEGACDGCRWREM